MLWRVVCFLGRVPLLFTHRFALRRRLRPVPATVRLATLGVVTALFSSPAAMAKLSRSQSIAAFDHATAVQQQLQAKPLATRTRMDYERALDAYRAVYHGDPASPDAPRSIAAVADLLASEGRCFRQLQLLHDAVEQWEFLRRQYPTSSLRQRALFNEGLIQQQDLHDRAAARATFRLFLKQYPRNSLAELARAGLRGEPIAEAATLAQREIPERKIPQSNEILAERSLRAEKFSPSEKTTQPARSRVSSKGLADASSPTPNNSLPKATISAKSLPSATIQDVRYWAENDSTRLAVDLSGAVPYRIYSQQNGRQISIVFFGADSAKTLVGHAIPASHDSNLRSMRVSMLTGNQATLVLQMKHSMGVTSFVLSNPFRVILDLQPALAPEFEPTAARPVQQSPAASLHTIAKQIQPSMRVILPPQPSSHTPTVAVVTNTESAPPSVSSPSSPTFPVEPASNVQPSMARILGLRVRRIVIDAGHGGHDSGTIGPNGLEEKDVALDVALRLGRLLQQRLGAQVIYTRRTDKFVPLEERTAIANAAHADLFLSIHANSSSDPQVRGIETYFLNFTASPDAMEVAARENADSNRSVYELSDMVRKIALSDKIDESRSFASDVQQKLYAGLEPGNVGLKNRGVKQAPFVVLIGAQMPSILAEISFLTNPESASELTHPAYRERLAEALYRGVAEYVQGMSGIRVAKTTTQEVLPDPAE